MSEILAVEMKNITKVYPNGVVANYDVNFSTRQGEIHALMGENGAGKSTLVKILFGLESYSQGEIYVNGKKATIDSPTKAISLGIGMVHQHFMLVPNLSVCENIILGMEPVKKGLIDYQIARKMVMDTTEKYNFKIDPDALIRDIDVGKKQKVEIIKALIRGAKILIMDEPTAVLTPQECDELFEQLELLKKEGHTIIFISHKLNEIKEICDRITILRHGKCKGVFETFKLSTSDISRLMIGRDAISEIEKTPAEKKDSVLEIRNLIVSNSDGKVLLNNISMNIHKGVILGIAGVEGNGQRELIDSIAGLTSPDSGIITIKGQRICGKSIRQIRNLGLSHIPEDRIKYGVAGDESVSDNLISERYYKEGYSSIKGLNYKKISKESQELVDAFSIKIDTLDSPVKMLSGGNIQKIVAAREMTSHFDILIADQPTRGIDVGAAQFVHEKIVEVRDSEKAVLLISADINEVMALSDSLIVLYDGEITAYFEDASKVSEEELGMYMLGLKRMGSDEIDLLIN